MPVDDKDKKERKTQSKITPPKDDFYMGMLFMFGAMCKDPNGQEAAVIVDGKDRPVTWGVNFLTQPESYHSTKRLSWDPEDRYLGLMTACESVIDRALKIYLPGVSVSEPFTGHVMYSTSPPSLRAVRRSAANGLRTIVYGPLRSQLFDEVDWAESQRLAEICKVALKRFDGNLGWTRDRVWTLSHMYNLF